MKRSYIIRMSPISFFSLSNPVTSIRGGCAARSLLTFQSFINTPLTHGVTSRNARALSTHCPFFCRSFPSFSLEDCRAHKTFEPPSCTQLQFCCTTSACHTCPQFVGRTIIVQHDAYFFFFFFGNYDDDIPGAHQYKLSFCIIEICYCTLHDRKFIPLYRG